MIHTVHTRPGLVDEARTVIISTFKDHFKGAQTTSALLSMLVGLEGFSSSALLITLKLPRGTNKTL